ncbi:hypothetical protein PVAND_009658 [Polypedilum vanderplanki]|uniref:Nucleolus and neural progenitor protein-like N-terminal domain-containing protein n=1 Tax=Polypedilum vanderplanki TaxID=319348 RepID=A0A9J6CDX6_POLVA|nr:hypothetical protein PVAND_009658 [Polypedilum vanderplanki]
MEYWNEINLIIPPYLSYPISRKKIDIKGFKKILQDSINYFNNIMKEFKLEVKQLSQFLFLSFNQLRMMKGYQEMKKTHQAAERIERIDIINILEIFNSYISDEFQSEVQIPFQQNLDYVLIRLQGFSKILIRLITCSKKSAKYMLGLIKAGSFYIKGTIYVASLAKIWDYGREMCKYTVNLYNNLRVFRDKLLKKENLEWVADNCNLPEKLNDWLGEEFENFVNNHTYDFKMLTKKEDLDNYIASKTKSSTLFENYKSEQEKKQEVTCMDYLDIKIEPKSEIDDYTPIERNIKKNVSEYNHSLESVTTKERLKLFLKFEDKYRKIDESKSLTIKKIKKNDWKEIKKDLSNKLNLMQESVLIDFKQFSRSDVSLNRNQITLS